MKHIRTFENYRIRKNREEIIKESVLQVNDIYKVKTMIDIPQSLINAYVKKVKDTTGKNLRQFFGDVDIAEEIVKYINMNFLDVEKIPGGALMGGGQTQVQGQNQPQVETEPQAQTQPQVETEPQAQTQPQEEAGAKPQENEVQPQVQPQSKEEEEEFIEPQGQGQTQKEEEKEEEEKEETEKLPEEEEEV